MCTWRSTLAAVYARWEWPLILLFALATLWVRWAMLATQLHCRFILNTGFAKIGAAVS